MAPVGAPHGQCDNSGVTSSARAASPVSRPVQPADVAAARAVLRPVIRQTPLLDSSALSALVGGPVYVKCENLQRGGSFKVRGAYLRIARLTAAERARGVVAASAGNHAQGVALAAAALGARSTVVMPAGAPLPKVAATRSYGADVVLHGGTVEDALALARELAAETGSIFIHPVRSPGRDRRPGHHRAGDRASSARRAHYRRAGRRRRTGRWRRGGGQRGSCPPPGSSACRRRRSRRYQPRLLPGIQCASHRPSRWPTG